jgi:drug/metabolite transporter (DMT)-like permease
MRLSNNRAGILYILLATFFLSVQSACAKYAMDSLPPLEVLFFRCSIALAMIGSYAVATKPRAFFKTRRPFSHFFRGLTGNIGVLLGIIAYSYMPMTQVTALLFTSSLIVTLLSALLLREAVGPWRWLAVLVGLLGVVLIAHHDLEHLGENGLRGILITLAAAFCDALVVMFLRELGRTEDPLLTVVYFLGMGTLLCGAYMIWAGIWPARGLYWVLGLLGVAGGFNQFFRTMAYRHAEASLLSPFVYTAIIWATAFGWLVWGDFPTLEIIAGAAIIVASNAIIVWREKIRRRAAQSEAAATPV